MKLYLLLLFIASSYAIDFNCLKGPKYFCSSLQNAERCGKVVECFMSDQNKQDGVFKMTNGLNKVKMNKGVNDVKCEICEKIVAELENKYIPKLTEQQFIDYVVNNVCNKLSNEYKGLCTTLMRQYGHEIYVQIKAYLDPAFVCKQLSYCSTSTILSPLPSSPETCKICKEVFGFLESLLNDITPDELKSILKLAICNQLPGPAQAMCNTLVDGYTDQVYNLLKSLLDGNRVCPAIHLCSSNIDKGLQSWNCQTCIDVITVLRKDLVNVSPAEVEAMAKDKVCSKVPFIARGFCDDSVDKYVPLFFTDLDSSLTPQQICAKNTLCMAPSLPPKETIVKQSVKGAIECDACELVVNEVKKILLSEAGEIRVKNFIKNDICKYFGAESQKCVEFVDKYGDILINFINTELTGRQICEMFGACSDTVQQTKLSLKKVSGFECKICTTILTKVKEFISEPTHETLVKNFIRNTVCSLFPSEKTQCQQAVDEYFNIIFNAIVAEFDVTKLCQALKLCTAVEKSKQEVTGVVKCDVCEVVMSEVVMLVTSKESQQRIEDFLTSKICPRLNILSKECITIVNTYIPFLSKLAHESLNSKILCSRLNLCTLVNEKNVRALLKSMEVKSFQCNLCQFAVNETRSLLSDTSIQTMLENFLKQEICSFFGAKKQECINDITEYYSFVINLILEFLTPSFCTEIHLCAAKQGLSNKMPMLNLIKSKKLDGCKTCSSFYSFLKTITVNTPNNDIVLGLVSICGRYSRDDKRQCLNQLKKVGVIFESFMKAKSEAQFCEMSGMCSSTKVISNRRLGQNKCTWGPGFWCISREHAKLCGTGAVRHCETKVWKANPTI